MHIGLALPSEKDARQKIEETPTIPIERPVAADEVVTDERHDGERLADYKY